MTQQPSPQQAAAIEWVRTGSGNAILEAVAGAGKTTTLLRMVEALPPGKRAALVAYNKAIATEIAEKVAARGLNADVGTVHSFGFQALRRANKSIKVDGRKVKDIMRRLSIPQWYQDVVGQLVSHAKNGGVGVLVTANDVRVWNQIFDRNDLALALPEEYRQSVDVQQQAIEFAQATLQTSNRELSIIDFDDMCYLPLLCGLKPYSFDFVMLDEAQDTNETRRALVGQMVKEGGRFVAVGDPAQAIYGFTGANSDSLDRIAKDFNAIRLPLTVTYRCPKAVVRVARQWVSHIEAHESAPEGEYFSIDYDGLFGAQPNGAEDAILCRKTAPLVTLAYALIRKGTPCKVEGRAIGAGLLKLVRKWKGPKTVGAFLDKLKEWSAAEIQKAVVAEKFNLASAIEDQVECIEEIASTLAGRDPIFALEQKIEALFGDDVSAQGVLTLATIHRSKGREWKRVFWFGAETWQPSKFAKQQWQIEQEYNLMYVAATRAKETLIQVSAPPEAKARRAA
jgi:superfamily I DNA/RNA helicase